MSKREVLLTPMQLLFVANWEGSPIDAARKAGFKHPKEASCRVMKIPAVRKAIEEKQKSVIAQAGKELGRKISISRNDIIMGLADIAQRGESESARVSAYGHLKEIFGLSVKNGKDTDLFAGWTDEELEYYRSTGELPPDRRSQLGSSGSDGGPPCSTTT